MDSIRIRRDEISWMLLGGALLVLSSLLVAVLLLEHSGQEHAVLWVVLGGCGILMGAGGLYWGMRRFSLLNEQMEEARKQVAVAYQRLAAVFRLTRQFVEAEDEEALIERVLHLCLSLEGVRGASFVPLDPRGQPLPAHSRGDLPERVLNAWVEYMASPEVRHRCNRCQQLEAETGQECPLLSREVLPFTGAERVVCFHLRRGDQQLGVLNLYLGHGAELEAETRIWLTTMLDELALAMEIVRMRQQERQALRSLPTAHSQSQSHDLIQQVLQQAVDALTADIGLLILNDGVSSSTRRFLAGPASDAAPWLEGIVQGGLALDDALIMNEIQGESSDKTPFRSLIMVPLGLGKRQRGLLLVASQQPKAFTRRHLSLVELFAAQAAMIFQQGDWMAQIERRAWMEERARLAREIHDGLAQTISFLKLQVVQLQQALQHNDFDRLEHGLQVCYRSLSEAYLDVREAIDGLRLTDHGGDLRAWVRQLATEFEANTGIQVLLADLDAAQHLPLEVQAQLVRIIQEALSNVRRHAQASQVWVRGSLVGDDWVLEVRDDGVGFLPDDVPPYEHHGLRGMRERAEKIGAEFQIVSRPQEGTTVRVALPAILLSEETL